MTRGKTEKKKPRVKKGLSLQEQSLTFRVSTIDQDLEKNKADILKLANDKSFGKVEFIEEKASGYKTGWKVCIPLTRLPGLFMSGRTSLMPKANSLPLDREPSMRSKHLYEGLLINQIE